MKKITLKFHRKDSNKISILLKELKATDVSGFSGDTMNVVALRKDDNITSICFNGDSIEITKDLLSNVKVNVIITCIDEDELVGESFGYYMGRYAQCLCDKTSYEPLVPVGLDRLPVKSEMAEVNNFYNIKDLCEADFFGHDESIPENEKDLIPE